MLNEATLQGLVKVNDALYNVHLHFEAHGEKYDPYRTTSYIMDAAEALAQLNKLYFMDIFQEQIVILSAALAWTCQQVEKKASVTTIWTMTSATEKLIKAEQSRVKAEITQRNDRAENERYMAYVRKHPDMPTAQIPYPVPEEA